MTDRRLIICVTVAECPVAPSPSEIRWCTICAETLWQSVDSMGVEGEPICMACAPGVTLDDYRFEIPAAVRQRLHRHGIDDREIRRITRYVDRKLKGK